MIKRRKFSCPIFLPNTVGPPLCCLWLSAFLRPVCGRECSCDAPRSHRGCSTDLQLRAPFLRPVCRNSCPPMAFAETRAPLPLGAQLWRVAQNPWLGRRIQADPAAFWYTFDMNLRTKRADTASILPCTVFSKKIGQKIFLIGLVKKEEIFVSHLFAKHRTRFCPSENQYNHRAFGSCKNAPERSPWVGSGVVVLVTPATHCFLREWARF